MTMTYPFPVSGDEFKGKRVLVTGGTKGLGQAMVRRFTLSGASVATTARSPLPDGQAVAVFVQTDIGTAAVAALRWNQVGTRLQPTSFLHCRRSGVSTSGGALLMYRSARSAADFASPRRKSLARSIVNGFPVSSSKFERKSVQMTPSTLCFEPHC